MDYEAEYNPRLQVPGYRDIFARWQLASAAVRQSPRAVLDQPYGPGERQRYDGFPAGDPDAPLVVFIHGGYWQIGGREDVAFVARALNAAGLDVAIPSYSLCPSVSLLQIVDELRRFLAALWTASHKRPMLIGHSAGGHLTAAMLASRWGDVPGVPVDLVRVGCTLSGVFELAPLVSTTINAALRLTDETASAASPLLWPAPRPGCTLVAAVGSEETGEFHRQSRAMARAWAEAGLDAEYLSIAGANHYTILDALTDPDSALFGRVVALARR
jgi:arylformamidase